MLEDMARKSYLWPNERLPQPMKVSIIHEVDSIMKLIV